MTLNEVSPGEKCTILDVDLNGAVLQRLLDMGFIEGALVEVIRNAPLLDPLDVRIQRNLVAIRRNEAAGIEVEPA